MSRISVVEYDELSELFWLTEGYPFKPYSQYSQIDCDVLSEAFFEEIRKIAAEKENRIITIKENHSPVALCIARKSIVESEVFCKDIFAITHLISGGSYKDSVSNKQKLLRFFLLNIMKSTGMVSCRANSEDLSTIYALENNTFRYMDSLVTYAFDLRKSLPEYKGNPYRIRPVKKTDGDNLKKIVRDSQFMDRFHNDPHFSRKESDRLYETFIGNAIKGKGVDRVLVAECEHQIAGFNTIESQNHHYSSYGIRIGSFVLNAVAPEFRSRGIYSSLMEESLRYTEDSADLVEIRTHAGNYPVHRALPRIGFRLSLSQLTFHAWNAGIMPFSGKGNK